MFCPFNELKLWICSRAEKRQPQNTLEASVFWIFQHLQRHRRFVECDSIVISGLGPFETQHSHLIYLALSHHCDLRHGRDLPSMSPRRMRRHSTFRNSCQKRDFSHAERNTSSSGVQESLQNALLQTPCIDGSLQNVPLWLPRLHKAT